MIMAAGVEKALDLAMIAVLASSIFFLVDFRIVGESFLLAALAGIVATVGALFVWRAHGHVIARRLAASALAQAVHGFLAEQTRPGRVAGIAGFTFVIWTLNVLSTWVAIYGLVPTAAFGVIDAVAILLISVLAIAIPSAPAGLGVFEAGIVAYLTQRLAVPSEPAVMAAIVFHLVVSAPQVILMAIILAVKRPEHAGGEDDRSSGRPVAGRGSV
jgi:uncharacterized membrane protein YbhN (UPF0104 family)